jgi:hypothetical protein
MQMDAEHSRRSPLGQRIAHGALGLSVCTGLSARLGYLEGSAIAALGVDGWRFLKPIFFGDTVHLQATVVSARPTSKPDRGVLVRRMELVNQHGAVVQTGGIAVLGRLALGSGIDRIDARMASAAAFCMRGGALVLMASCPGWPTGLFLGVVLFGINIGNVATFPALIIGREFDAAVFMRFLGLCTAIGPLQPDPHRPAAEHMAGCPPGLAVCFGLSFLAALTVIWRPGGGSGRRQRRHVPMRA